MDLQKSLIQEFNTIDPNHLDLYLKELHFEQELNVKILEEECIQLQNDLNEHNEELSQLQTSLESQQSQLKTEMEARVDQIKNYDISEFKELKELLLVQQKMKELESYLNKIDNIDASFAECLSYRDNMPSLLQKIDQLQDILHIFYELSQFNEYREKTENFLQKIKCILRSAIIDIFEQPELWQIALFSSQDLNCIYKIYQKLQLKSEIFIIFQNSLLQNFKIDQEKPLAPLQKLLLYFSPIKNFEFYSDILKHIFEKLGPKIMNFLYKDYLTANQDDIQIVYDFFFLVQENLQSFTKNAKNSIMISILEPNKKEVQLYLNNYLDKSLLNLDLALKQSVQEEEESDVSQRKNYITLSIDLEKLESILQTIFDGYYELSFSANQDLFTQKINVKFVALMHQLNEQVKTLKNRIYAPDLDKFLMKKQEKIYFQEQIQISQNQNLFLDFIQKFEQICHLETILISLQNYQEDKISQNKTNYDLEIFLELKKQFSLNKKKEGATDIFEKTKETRKNIMQTCLKYQLLPFYNQILSLDYNSPQKKNILSFSVSPSGALQDLIQEFFSLIQKLDSLEKKIDINYQEEYKMITNQTKEISEQKSFWLSIFLSHLIDLYLQFTKKARNNPNISQMEADIRYLMNSFSEQFMQSRFEEKQILNEALEKLIKNQTVNLEKKEQI